MVVGCVLLGEGRMPLRRGAACLERGHPALDSEGKRLSAPRQGVHGQHPQH